MTRDRRLLQAASVCALLRDGIGAPGPLRVDRQERTLRCRRHALCQRLRIGEWGLGNCKCAICADRQGVQPAKRDVRRDGLHLLPGHPAVHTGPGRRWAEWYSPDHSVSSRIAKRRFGPARACNLPLGRPPAGDRGGPLPSPSSSVSGCTKRGAKVGVAGGRAVVSRWHSATGTPTSSRSAGIGACQLSDASPGSRPPPPRPWPDPASYAHSSDHRPAPTSASSSPPPVLMSA